MKISKILCKNVEFLMSESHQGDLLDYLKIPSNEWLGAGLQSVVETDENGLIIRFKPTGIMTASLVHFFQQLMLEQRCYLMDIFLKEQGVIK